MHFMYRNLLWKSYKEECSYNQPATTCPLWEHRALAFIFCWCEEVSCNVWEYGTLTSELHWDKEVSCLLWEHRRLTSELHWDEKVSCIWCYLSVTHYRYCIIKYVTVIIAIIPTAFLWKVMSTSTLQHLSLWQHVFLSEVQSYEKF